jgi:hypothetical protein
MSTMQGTLSYPFGEMFRDTVREHGSAWACQYYTRRGMPEWELKFWLRSIDDDETRWFWKTDLPSFW